MDESRPKFSAGSGSDGGDSDGTEDGDTSEDNDGILDLSPLWDWLDGIVDGITGIVESIQDLPSLIYSGLKAIFIPDADYINISYSSFVDFLSTKFNLDTTAFEHLFDSENPVDDQFMDYSIPGVGSFKLKVLDTAYLKQGVEYFRPIIRGFLVLLMFLFHVKQFIGFFGYNAGVVDGRTEHIKGAKE